VNGSLVASAAGVDPAQNYSGWWSIGYGYLASWPIYRRATISRARGADRNHPSQLSSAQVSSLYGDSTLSTYAAGVSALSR